MKQLLLATWKLAMRVLVSFGHIPTKDCISLSPIQRYMLDSEAEWQVAYLEYCWQLDATKHYHEQ